MIVMQLVILYQLLLVLLLLFLLILLFLLLLFGVVGCDSGSKHNPAPNPLKLKV
jgi:hypothetical protein